MTAPASPPSAAHPPAANAFGYPLFRTLWSITLIVNLSLWMQNVGASWVMVSRDESPFMVALVQTATTLPMLVFGLPAGVLADLAERRRLLLVTHAGMLLAAAAIAAMACAGMLTAWSMLALMFAAGTCNAFTITARQASISDAVPRVALVHGLALNSIAYNGARAIGPALAGAVLAWLGPAELFLVVAAMLVVAVLLQACFYGPAPAGMQTGEPALAAMRTGIRYVRHARTLHANFVRSIVFVLCASSLWALLPVLSRDRLGFGAAGYGLLLGCMGGGAVASGALMEWLRRRYALHRMATASGLMFAGAMLIAALVPHAGTVCTALVAGGAAWVVNNSTLSAAIQTALPSWVRARALSIYLLLFQGAMALGGTLWGAFASRIGASAVLAIAGALAVGSVLYLRRFPVQLGNEADVTPSPHCDAPPLWTQPEPDDGPVLIQIEYRIRPERRADFIRAVHALGVTRRRDGASHWRLYRDLTDPDLYAERFTVYSWAEYLRQQTRATLTDHDTEETVRRMHCGEQAIKISRLLAQSPA